MKSIKYGLLTYSTNNIGDDIQSIAARQFLPRVDEYLDRDYLNKVKSDSKIKIILNGWFLDKPGNWPPAACIAPLIISFHISQYDVESMTSGRSISYLKRHQPIGCRDYYTRDLVRRKGVEAYFSGCLTLTLKSAPNTKRTPDILLVDLNEKAKKALPTQLMEASELISHYFYFPATERSAEFLKNRLEGVSNFTKKIKLAPLLRNVSKKVAVSTAMGVPDNEGRLLKAEELLKRYASAKLVITSRLHCVLPCMAFNTPVIFVHESLPDPRFQGYFLNSYSLDEFLKECHKPGLPGFVRTSLDVSRVRKKLIKSCENFISGD